MRHSLNKLIMRAWSKTKLNMDLWKWHMNLIKAKASKWAELNHWPDSCMCFDFTAETSKPSTLWGLPDSTVPPPPTDYKAASCLFGSNYRKHRCALLGKVQGTTSPIVVQSLEVCSEGSGLAQSRSLPQTQTGVPTKWGFLTPSAPHPEIPPNRRCQTHHRPCPVQFYHCPNHQLNASTWGTKPSSVRGWQTRLSAKEGAAWLISKLIPVPTAQTQGPATQHTGIPYPSEESPVWFIFC